MLPSVLLSGHMGRGMTDFLILLGDGGLAAGSGGASHLRALGPCGTLSHIALIFIWDDSCGVASSCHPDLFKFMLCWQAIF